MHSQSQVTTGSTEQSGSWGRFSGVKSVDLKGGTRPSSKTKSRAPRFLGMNFARGPGSSKGKVQ